MPRSAIRRALLCTAVVGAIGAWLALGSVPYVQVNVKWAADTPAAARDYAAKRLSLRSLREDDSGFSVYFLTNPSRTNVSAMFSTPGIESIGLLDAKTLQPTEYQHTTPAIWLGMRYGHGLSKFVRPMALFPVAAFAVLVALLLSTEGRAWLLNRIPLASPTALGVFRVALGSALVPWVLRTVPESMPYLRVSCLVCLALFITGTLARLSLIGFIVAFGMAHLEEIGKHDFALPLRTLVLLILVPWGDGFSVDEAIRRLRGRATPNILARKYGVGMWIPMFMLGIGYFAAAFAKIDQSGMRWLTGGAARYFFIIDGPGAPDNLWRVIASSDLLSQLISAGAVFAEATVIAGALWSVPPVMLLAGAAAASLHLGFWLFQGHWWPGWWALLLAFVPWQAAVSRFQRHMPHQIAKVARVPAVRARDLPLVTAVVLCVVALQQPIVSLFVLERGPYISSFPMYADVNWGSKEEFVASMYREHYPSKPALRLEPVDGSSASVMADRLRDVDEDGVVSESAFTVAAGDTLDDRRVADLARVASMYENQFGTRLPALRILTADWRFDWSAAGFVPRADWSSKGVLSIQ